MWDDFYMKLELGPLIFFLYFKYAFRIKNNNRYLETKNIIGLRYVARRVVHNGTFFEFKLLLLICGAHDGR